MSPKQTKIYYELLSGKSYLEIAEKFNISTETVKTHCRAIYNHFEVKNQRMLMGLVLQAQEIMQPEAIRQLSRNADNSR